MSNFAFSGPQGGLQTRNPPVYPPLVSILIHLELQSLLHLNVKFFWVGSKPSGTSF